MVPFYGVFDFTDRFGIRGAADPLRRLLERQVVKRRRREDPDVFADASPMERVHTDAPPALVVHGDLDTLAPVEEARRFVEVLRSVSREPVVYVELPGTHHAFDVFHSVRTLHTIEGVDAFLEWIVSSRVDAARSTGRGSSTATTGPTTTARTAP
jgi:acetyl esterase/lipase